MLTLPAINPTVEVADLGPLAGIDPFLVVVNLLMVIVFSLIGGWFIYSGFSAIKTRKFVFYPRPVVTGRAAVMIGVALMLIGLLFISILYGVFAEFQYFIETRL